ncbi:hypothetical protein K9M16_04875 [Candidatus Babeliales bacterium]|nr:hypothetical protein [Candidatus Babeliales bacterium]
MSQFKDMAQQAVVKMDYLSLLLSILLVFFTAFVLSYITIKVYKYLFYRFRFRRARILLLNLYTELILRKNINSFDDKKKLEVELTYVETMDRLNIFFRKEFVKKRIGQHGSQRIADGLHLIFNKQLKLEEELDLVKNWVKVVSTYL